MRAKVVLRTLLDKFGASVSRTARRETPSQLTIRESSEAMVALSKVIHYFAVVCSGALASNSYR